MYNDKQDAHQLDGVRHARVPRVRLETKRFHVSGAESAGERMHQHVYFNQKIFFKLKY
jgi:hypothetical protein